jgi:cation-transporting P-type ATPase E
MPAPTDGRGVAEPAASTRTDERAAGGPGGTAPDGRSREEAARRLAERPPLAPQGSRSVGSIVRANALTLFNVLLVGFGILELAFGDIRDALFLAILIANTGIGILQELRAKRTLDRLSALVAPTATVIRSGEPERVPVEGVVDGDLVRLGPGDQVVADGTLRTADDLSLDESVLSGESRPVRRAAGDAVRSGSFVVEGTGTAVVTATGEESYAGRLAGEAREFRHPRSPLEQALDRLLLVLTAVLVPLGILLGYALWRRHEPFSDAVSTSVAAVVTLVPEGLILLTSVTFAIAALRIARRGALAQQLSAIEALASADVVCLDKTGTLTEPGLRVTGLLPARGLDEAALGGELARYAAAVAVRNSTLEAIAAEFPGPPGTPVAQVPFSSRRRWGAIRLGDETLVLGAPELIPLGDDLAPRVAEEARQGRRVVALARTRAPLDPDAADEGPPGGLGPLGAVVLAERLRPAAAETVAFLRREGVAICVLSGDAPETVAAIARDAGIPMEGPALEGAELPSDPRELREVLAERPVVGRVAPGDKRRVVHALRGGGAHVAMVGDGVNDVPALKGAQLAIVQGSGAQIARAVADLVLVRDDFGSVPPMIAEGRKVLRNLQRVAKLFVAKSALAAFLILTIGLVPTSYPFLPRHLTLASAITIAIPSVFLALAPSAGPWRTEGFLKEVGRFAVPAGVAAGLGVVSAYLCAQNVAGLSLEESRTVATTTLVLVGLYLVIALEASGRRRSTWVGVLVAALLVIYLLALAWPGSQSFFSLDPSAGGIVIATFGAALAIVGLWLTDDRFVPGRRAAADS